MDYRFAIRCWQDKAGDDNAKANVFVGSTKVLSEVEITATSADSPQIVAWESTGLTAAADGVAFAVKVVLVNEYYVDADTDRNIWINGCGYITKATDGNYKQSIMNDATPQVKTGEGTITDFTDFGNYNYVVPTAVAGDQIASDWWSGRGDTTFFNIPVWGDDGDTGMTMTVPALTKTCSDG